MTYNATVLADTPVLYWKLDEASTSGPATDSSGNSRTGTYVNNPPNFAGLGSGTAILLNGSNQWITSTYNPFSLSSNRTFELWVDRNSNSSEDCMFGGDVNTVQPLLSCNAGANTVSFFTDANTAGQTWAGTVISVGVPTHVVLTWTGSTKTSELFINGVSQGTKVHSQDFNAAPGNFGVGKRSTTGAAFDGTVDEVAIYNSILTPTRILAHYNAAEPGTLPPQGSWYATMELGTLSEWNASSGGGEFDSGPGAAVSVASQDRARTGTWSCKQTLDTTGGGGGTRMFRWKEYRSLTVGQPATTSCWIYIPTTATIGGFFNLYQFKSKTLGNDCAGIPCVDVFWQVNLVNRSGAGSALKLALGWGCGAENPNFPRGPFSNSPASDQCDFNRFVPIVDVNVPIGSWFNITSEITPSSGYTGSFKVWQNDVLLWNIGSCMTGYAHTNSVNLVDTQWAVNAYGSNFTPAAWTHYVDDVSIIPGAYLSTGVASTQTASGFAELGSRLGYDFGQITVSSPRGMRAGNTSTQGGQFLSGTGAPSAGLGADGDTYFRTDTPGTSNQRIYTKSGGSWSGVT